MVPSARHARLGLAAVATVFSLAIGVLGFRAIERRIDRTCVAPGFVLPELDGRTVDLRSFQGKSVVLVFWSARCPLTHVYSRRVVRLAESYALDDRVTVLAVDSSVVEASVCELDELRVFKSVIGQRFPMLVDRGGEVARQYGIESLPAVVVIDRQGRIRYRGAFDDNADEAQVHERYCADALASLLAQPPHLMAYTQAFGEPIAPPK